MLDLHRTRKLGRLSVGLIAILLTLIVLGYFSYGLAAPEVVRRQETIIEDTPDRYIELGSTQVLSSLSQVAGYEGSQVYVMGRTTADTITGRDGFILPVAYKDDSSKAGYKVLSGQVESGVLTKAFEVADIEDPFLDRSAALLKNLINNQVSCAACQGSIEDCVKEARFVVTIVIDNDRDVYQVLNELEGSKGTIASVIYDLQTGQTKRSVINTSRVDCVDTRDFIIPVDPIIVDEKEELFIDLQPGDDKVYQNV